jgi:DNA-binding transcriptional regulator/RsmH inhibitor MraZ
MSANAKSLESHYDYKMDPKYRVSIPVDYRPDVEGAPIRLHAHKEHKLPVIKVYTAEIFEDKYRQIRESDLPQANKNALEGALRMNSKLATISPQGKLTIPKDWAEKIGLKADGPVKLGGRGHYFIICTPETFDRIVEIEEDIEDYGLGVL